MILLKLKLSQKYKMYRFKFKLFPRSRVLSRMSPRGYYKEIKIPNTNLYSKFVHVYIFLLSAIVNLRFFFYFQSYTYSFYFIKYEYITIIISNLKQNYIICVYWVYGCIVRFLDLIDLSKFVLFTAFFWVFAIVKDILDTKFVD